AGAETANEKTFAFGSLKPGKTLSAVWDVTPVKPGDYRLTYQVDAGLFGKAKAKTSDGSVPRGTFAVRISDVPPQTRVDGQGGVALTRIGDFDEPVWLTQAPGGALFVVERGGLIKVVNGDGQVADQPFLDLTDKVTTAGQEQGLLSMVLAPDYTKSGLFYV